MKAKINIEPLSRSIPSGEWGEIGKAIVKGLKGVTFSEDRHLLALLEAGLAAAVHRLAMDVEVNGEAGLWTDPEDYADTIESEIAQIAELGKQLAATIRRCGGQS
jgi:hypothetical protein